MQRRPGVVRQGAVLAILLAILTTPALSAAERGGCPVTTEIIEDDWQLERGPLTLADGSTVEAILQRVIVTLDERTISSETFRALQTFLRREGASITGQDPSECSLYVKVPQGVTIAAFIRRITRHPGVLTVEADIIPDEPKRR